MASSFDRWEKDPFFSAAEEVQESADRMESTYRTWVHAKSDAAKEWNLEELRRDLHTAVGTTKWQLEEFERAVRSSYVNDSTDDAKDRHRDFIVAIEDQVTRVQKSLHESAVSEGKERPSWVWLNEGESKELALFLTGTSASNENPQDRDDAVENSFHSSEKSYGHRRTASANANIDAWKIAIPDDSQWQQNSSSGHPPLPPRKIPSLSSFLNSMDSSPSKSKWSKNGFRKLKAVDPNQECDSASLRSSQQARATNACYERSKSCLDSCDDCYDKQLYGWYGAVQRQLQRSQYQMRYSRPAQLTFSAVLLCLIC
ncbi:hypothetical protein CDL15_Pgr014480 [Punica granatum]|uniref:Syntaxin 6/10/61 N-terminal domain-containing protein n=1 Tax=Punica granatum TaxID=22663 RepID=A0A218WD49_PUNGR|nr:hypothetical protein CDL15_Pgr014480 [Punica granatum]